MAYSTANPPIKTSSGIASGTSTWVYTSGDAHTDVDAADYFSNAAELGMRVADLVIVLDTATPTTTIHQVTAISAAGAGSISTATLA